MIPAYNQEEYIGQAIESALAQDYPNLEIVVSDDCSTDNIHLIIKNYQNNPKVKFFRNERNLGMLGNYRKLLCEHATGDWVIMLDGDDYFVESQFIRPAIEEIKRHESAAMAIFGYKAVYSDKDFTLLPTDKTRYMNGYDIFMRFYRMNVIHANVFYKRELAIKVGGYEYVCSPDYGLFLKMLLQGDALLINRVNYVWRHHVSNRTDTLPLETCIIGNKKFIDDVYRYAFGLGYNKNKLSDWKKKMLSWYYFAYISNKVRSLKRGLITKKEADRDINALIAYMWKNEKPLLFSDANILGRIILYKLLGARLFESVIHIAKKMKQRNKYALIKST